LLKGVFVEIKGKIAVITGAGSGIGQAAALELANRAYILEQGRIVGTGTGAELLTDQRVREAYLGYVEE